MKKPYLTLPVVWMLFLLVAILPTVSSAVQDSLESVYEKSLARINEAGVKATVSFLASDELKGRGTGTAEFNIAAAYVASRFEAAGLTGGGTNDSFFHIKELEMVQTPSDGASLQDDNGREIPHLGLLKGAEEKVDLKGAIVEVDLAQLGEIPDGTQLVFANYTSPTGRRGRGGGLAAISEAAVKLRAKGVQGIILVVDPDDNIVAQAKRFRGLATPATPRSNVALPVLLVDRSQLDSFAALKQVTAKFPSQIKSIYQARNVIGVLKGSDPTLAAECVIFSAHLDHLGETETIQDDRIFNGADDDASGVTAVLSLADAYGQIEKRPARSVVFITYWGEESGLLGSREFVASPPWPLEKIAANVNIEMIGRPEPGANNKIWVTGWGKSDLGTIMNTASQEIGIEIFEHPQYSAMLYQASDNWPLAEAGVVAHSFSAGSLHSDYHQPSDEWQKLNIPHMTQVIKGLFVGSLPVANGNFTPKKAN